MCQGPIYSRTDASTDGTESSNATTLEADGDEGKKGEGSVDDKNFVHKRRK